ncbi:tyrosinase [Seiridium cupressi]
MADTTPKSTSQSAQADNTVFPLVQANPKAFRLEIDEFLADNALTNLFLLGLEELQKNSVKLAGTNDPNWWSFYSLSGIHSLPREAWAGIKNSRGYCHHGMNTFAPWHRPYMFQFEQAVYNQMAIIANRYTDTTQKKMYLEALSRFRLPYWDVCMPRYRRPEDSPVKTEKERGWRWGFPKILKTKEVYVRRPESPNELKPMKNPMYTFNFPKTEEYKGLEKVRPQIQWGNDTAFRHDYTTRTPSKGSTGAADSNYDDLEMKIQRQTQVLATSLWHMLNPEEIGDNNITGQKVKVNQLRSWNLFANHDATSNEFATQSVESWHDAIHMLVGTGVGFSGHMSNPAIAAFDPVFWLHHNNIDRLFAIFQALYPDKYVTPGKRADANPPMSDKDPNTLADDDLIPFKKPKDLNKTAKDSAYWTSTDLTDWTKAGFAVPGIDKSQPEAVKTAVEQYLRDTYYWATDALEPPNSLKWPKDLSHVEALTGKSEPVTETPVVQMKAISLEDGLPHLVARSFAMVHNAVVEEKPISVDAISKNLETNANKLPEGSLIDADKAAVPTKMRTWNAHVRVKKFAYDGSFNVHFFIGWVKDEQPERFMTKMNEVGFVGVFASPESTQCESCAKNRERDLVYEDTVPLTGKLLDYLASNSNAASLIRDGNKKTIDTLEPDEIIPFLKEHLQWRITDASSQLLDIGNSGLEVKVADRLFEPPHDDNLLGTYGPSTVHTEITQGKEGGFTG